MWVDLEIIFFTLSIAVLVLAFFVFLYEKSRTNLKLLKKYKEMYVEIDYDKLISDFEELEKTQIIEDFDYIDEAISKLKETKDERDYSTMKLIDQAIKDTKKSWFILSSKTSNYLNEIKLNYIHDYITFVEHSFFIINASFSFNLVDSLRDGTLLLFNKISEYLFENYEISRNGKLFKEYNLLLKNISVIIEKAKTTRINESIIYFKSLFTNINDFSILISKSYSYLSFYYDFLLPSYQESSKLIKQNANLFLSNNDWVEDYKLSIKKHSSDIIKQVNNLNFDQVAQSCYFMEREIFDKNKLVELNSNSNNLIHQNTTGLFSNFKNLKKMHNSFIKEISSNDIDDKKSKLQKTINQYEMIDEQNKLFKKALANNYKVYTPEELLLIETNLINEWILYFKYFNDISAELKIIYVKKLNGNDILKDINIDLLWIEKIIVKISLSKKSYFESKLNDFQVMANHYLEISKKGKVLSDLERSDVEKLYKQIYEFKKDILQSSFLTFYLERVIMSFNKVANEKSVSRDLINAIQELYYLGKFDEVIDYSIEIIKVLKKYGK